MPEPIQYLVRWNIKPGCEGAFAALLRAVVDAIRVNEPGMLGYRVYFDDAGTTCYLIERFRDSRAVIEHLEHVGGTVAKVVELSDTHSVEVFGNISAEARALLCKRAPHSVFHREVDGFSR
jgi:quinol monooxygenase YgiN